MGGGTGTGGEDKPRRRIYVGLSRSYMDVKDGDGIYVAVNLYQKDLIEVRGASYKKFLLEGDSLFAFDKEKKNNPREYIEKLAMENNCEVDYSSAIERGLDLINKLEAMIKEGAKTLGSVVV